MGGRLLRIGLVLLVLVALIVVWEPSRVAVQTAVMLPNLLDAGPKPLSTFSEAPQRSAITYRSDGAASSDLAELWLPAWASEDRQAGAMLLVFGVNNVGRNHPAIVRVADGLARTGVAVLVPDQRTLLEGRLEVGEINGVVQAFETLHARPEVDPERVGIVGFSVGGSLALIAAADERIADDVRWINPFGAFAEADSYLTSVAAHAYIDPNGELIDWLPAQLTREVYLRFLLDQVTDVDDRTALDNAYGRATLLGEQPMSMVGVKASLETDEARAVEELLTVRDLDSAQQALAGLPGPSREFIEAISPLGNIDGLRADVYLMHERADHHVPYVQSRLLAAALDDGLLVTHTEFRLFDHVQPDDLDLIAAAPELWKLLWHLHGLMLETL
ncbi:MAG: dienelactone hydrolase family protein [Candidatus Limnocylindria bacterium]